MNKFRKVFILLLTFTILCCTTSNIAFADGFVVTEMSSLFSNEDFKKLRSEAQKYENFDVGFVLKESLNGKSADKVVDQIYDSKDLQNPVAIFLIVHDTKEARIITYGIGNDCFESEISSTIDFCYPSVESEDYYEAFSSMLSIIGNLFESAVANPDLYETNSPTSIGDFWTPTLNSLIFTLVITLIILAILLYNHHAANRPPKAAVYYTEKNGFTVVSHHVVYMGSREEVIRGYYKKK